MLGAKTGKKDLCDISGEVKSTQVCNISEIKNYKIKEALKLIVILIFKQVLSSKEGWGWDGRRKKKRNILV